MKTVIMAGGKGTRIASVRSDVPKPMIEICGKPILQYQIENLKAFGLTDIRLVIGHLGGAIKRYFGNGEKFGVNITYFEETEPLVKMNDLTEDFLLLCGDIIFDIDFNRFIAFHTAHRAWATLLSHPNGHPYDSSLLVTRILPPQTPGGLPEDSHQVIQWLNKEDERLYYKNRVNAGIEIISPQLLKAAAESFGRQGGAPQKIDLDRDVLKPNIKSGNIFAYDSPEYIKDMGTPERYYETQEDIKSGKVRARNLSHKQKCVFLDRDGTLNKPNGFITKPDDFELLPGAAEAVRLINKSGYLAIVVTNQPVIARGECTFEELAVIHNKMETELGKAGAFIDALYFCPHHPDKGFAGERAEYKCQCKCRKPAIGMLLQAAEDFNIDLTQSYMAGDNANDILAGVSAGCEQTVLLASDIGLLDYVKSAIYGELDF